VNNISKLFSETRRKGLRNTPPSI